MQYVTVGRVREQRKQWWKEMMIWFDIGVATVGVVAILAKNHFKFSILTRVLSASSNDMLARYLAISLTISYFVEGVFSNILNYDSL